MGGAHSLPARARHGAAVLSPVHGLERSPRRGAGGPVTHQAALRRRLDRGPPASRAALRRLDRRAAPGALPAAAGGVAAATARVQLLRGALTRRPARRAVAALASGEDRLRGLLPGAVAPARVPGFPGLRP